ncbi:hypothetical protein J5N97_007650 [Dioscorea zingiberensis]|uniref:Uncharacterized protein n=1 Tax=Dioscorea zingiberensis TaxID=325984 RepID=A0A9D5DD02_9LILI|nr:hypothetical protein J5N97_007650 [Dioscorea zingiberensis]
MAMDLSQPQRILLLIDLHPLLVQNPNPNPYITSILAAIRAFISSLPPTTLTAFKPIISSLSPILSTSLSHRLFGKSPFPLSFDLPSQTLASLCQSLGSLPTLPHSNAEPCASALAQSLLQLDHDYAWESGISDSKGMQKSLALPSNLVVFFTPFPRSLRSLSEFIDLEFGDDEKLLTWDAFSMKFTLVFGPVYERFVSKDIHLCWIDVNFDALCKKEESLGFVFLEKGIKEIGWGCCSSDVMVLGSSLVPFGLVFPEIACLKGFRRSNNNKLGNVELILEVTDVCGKPLECKICDLEVLDLMPPRDKSVWHDYIFRNKDSGTRKIHIRKVMRDIQVAKVMESPCCLFLLHRVSGEPSKDGDQHSMNEFFADKVLKLLCAEDGGFTVGKPAWQILLAFFYRRNFVALVSIVDGEGRSIEGMLMPFTVNYAVLCIVKDNSMYLNQLVISTKNCSPEILTSGIGFGSDGKNDRRKLKRMNRNILRDISWSSFRELAFSQAGSCALGFELEEVYFTKGLSKSKKLRFLKCWMRQLKESSDDHQLVLNEISKVPHVGERNEGEFGLQIEPEPQDVPLQSSGQACSSRSVSEEDSPFSSIEDVEAFFESIPQKIEHGLRSEEESDLGFLAERLVCLCIQAAQKKIGSNIEEEPATVQHEDACDVKIVAKVSDLLLQKPKELLLKSKGCKLATAATDPKSASYCTEEKIREHELQILLRMEILRSKIGEGIEDNLKQKMVKDICSLLLNIEFDLERDLFQGESLVHFAERTIKSRYAHSLEVVTNKIYNQMEFFSFCDDLEASESLPNSTNDELQRVGDNLQLSIRASISQNTCEATNPMKTDTKDQHEETSDKDHEQRLLRAQERRDRNRRLTSFTSWMPDLRRVWAPKQTRTERQIHVKQRRKRTRINDVVCETPMTEKKQHSQQPLEFSNAENASKFTGTTNSSCRSLCIALFQNDEDPGDQSKSTL